MRKFLSFIAMLLLIGCTPKTVISPSYNFNKLDRIGIMEFSSPYNGLSGVENLFAKYLIQSGFKVVERAQLDQVLREHNIAVSGYLSPATTKKIGEILGVDVLLVGEITAYSPSRKEMALIATRKTESHPVYAHTMMPGPDGKPTPVAQRVGTSYSQSMNVEPSEYTINAQVGIIAKLIDVETAEIVWIGSLSQESSRALDAADNIARGLVKSFTKELAKKQGN